MRRFIIFLIIILISTNLYAEQNDIDKEDFFYIGKMASHNEKFTLYFKTRQKAILARGEEYNYITDFPQDLYIYNHHTQTDESLISCLLYTSDAADE